MRLQKATFLTATLIAATAALVSASTDQALATAPVSVVAFADADLPRPVASIAERVFNREEIATRTVRAVSPADASHAAGVFVALTTRGEERAAVYAADGMTGFDDLSRVDALGGVMAFPSATGDRSKVVTATLVGLASKRVDRLLVTVAGGGIVEAELAAVGTAGYKAFAFVASQPGQFPVSYTAYDAEGAALKSEDLRRALAVPCGAMDCTEAGS